jgi:uncharacterized membrane protein SirB2
MRVICDETCFSDAIAGELRRTGRQRGSAKLKRLWSASFNLRDLMRSHHIIDSAATLLGVSLIIVTAVHITGKAASSIADELSFAAALLFLVSCGASHRAISKREERFEYFADKVFAVALVVLLCGVLSFWL